MKADNAYQRLQKYEEELQEYLDKDLSESDTRAKLIDFFLREVLGWSELHIERERTYWNETGRAAFDYAVGIKTRCSLWKPNGRVSHLSSLITDLLSFTHSMVRSRVTRISGGPFYKHVNIVMTTVCHMPLQQTGVSSLSSKP